MIREKRLQYPDGLHVGALPLTPGTDYRICCARKGNWTKVQYREIV
jgi:hypothetical protein